MMLILRKASVREAFQISGGLTSKNLIACIPDGVVQQHANYISNTEDAENIAISCARLSHISYGSAEGLIRGRKHGELERSVVQR